MSLKRWVAGLCLVVMLGSEILLFRANRERDAARADLATAEQQLQQAQKELDTLKNTGAQAAEIASLHKQNDALTTKANALQQRVDKLEADSLQAQKHLTTARDALALQQEHLQQLQAEQQQAQMVANANTCINNLRQIDAAKQQWALEKNKTATDVPTVQDLLPYFPSGAFPVCPDGGTYSINSAGELPTCSVPGHVLPSQ